MISVGKINDIFVGEGITESNHSDSSVHGMQQTIDIAKRDFKGLCFTNLVDLMRYGDIAEIQWDTGKRSKNLIKSWESFCRCSVRTIC